MLMRSLLLLAGVIAGAVINTYYLSVASEWLWAVLFGALLPIFAIVQWSFVRRQESSAVANRTLAWVLTGQIALLPLAESLAEQATADGAGHPESDHGSRGGAT